MTFILGSWGIDEKIRFRWTVFKYRRALGVLIGAVQKMANGTALTTAEKSEIAGLPAEMAYNKFLDTMFEFADIVDSALEFGNLFLAFMKRAFPANLTIQGIAPASGANDTDKIASFASMMNALIAAVKPIFPANAQVQSLQNFAPTGNAATDAYEAHRFFDRTVEPFKPIFSESEVAYL